MIRGTTPTNKFKLPFDTGLAKEIFVTYAQNNRVVLEKGIDEVLLEADAVIVELSQADTLLFSNTPQGAVQIQLRVKFTDGTAMASKIIETTVGKILKDGEI